MSSKFCRKGPCTESLAGLCRMTSADRLPNRSRDSLWERLGRALPRPCRISAPRNLQWRIRRQAHRGMVGEEFSARGLDVECCTFVGAVVALDADSGREVWKTYMIPERPRVVGKNSLPCCSFDSDSRCSSHWWFGR